MTSRWPDLKSGHGEFLSVPLWIVRTQFSACPQISYGKPATKINHLAIYKNGMQAVYGPQRGGEGREREPLQKPRFPFIPLLKATGTGELVVCSTFAVTNIKRYIHNFPAATQDP